MFKLDLFQRGSIPANSGYAPKIHHTCVDLMILKNAHIVKLSTQRTLGIIDSEFNNNNNNSYIGKETLDNGLTLGTIALEQLSQPGRPVIDKSIAKRCAIYY